MPPLALADMCTWGNGWGNMPHVAQTIPTALDLAEMPAQIGPNDTGRPPRSSRHKATEPKVRGSNPLGRALRNLALPGFCTVREMTRPRGCSIWNEVERS